jgi:cytoskeletal protein CcmA (bactofilin family)
MKRSLPTSTATEKLTNILRPHALRRQAGAHGGAAASGTKIKGEFESFLDNGTSFEGKVSLTGRVRLDGELRGEVHADELVIGESGRVEAKLSVRSLTIHGSVTGEITAKERVEVGATGTIDGSVHTPRLEVAEGARIDGEIEMGESPRQA